MSDKQPFDQRTCTPEERAVFMEIQRAVLEPAPKTIHFTYTKDDGSKTERHAEPYEVVGGDRPQLAAWDIEKDGIRRFYLSGMSNVRLGEAFNASRGFPIKIML